MDTSQIWNVVTSILAGVITIALVAVAKHYLRKPTETAETIAGTEPTTLNPHFKYLVDRFDFASLLVLIVVVALFALTFLGKEIGPLSSFSTMALIYWFWTKK